MLRKYASVHISTSRAEWIDREGFLDTLVSLHTEKSAAMRASATAVDDSLSPMVATKQLLGTPGLNASLLELLLELLAYRILLDSS